MGALAPHPSGDGWGDMLLQLYQVAMEDGSEVLPHFYYPLMARYCSEGNVEGEDVVLGWAWVVPWESCAVWQGSGEWQDRWSPMECPFK